MGRLRSVMVRQIVLVSLGLLAALVAGVAAEELASLDLTKPTDEAACQSCLRECTSSECMQKCGEHQCGGQIPVTEGDVKAVVSKGLPSNNTDKAQASTGKKADEEIEKSMQEFRQKQAKSKKGKGDEAQKAVKVLSAAEQEAELEKHRQAIADARAFNKTMNAATKSNQPAVEAVDRKWEMVRENGIQTARLHKEENTADGKAATAQAPTEGAAELPKQEPWQPQQQPPTAEQQQQAPTDNW